MDSGAASSCCRDLDTNDDEETTIVMDRNESIQQMCNADQQAV